MKPRTRSVATRKRVDLPGVFIRCSTFRIAPDELLEWELQGRISRGAVVLFLHLQRFSATERRDLRFTEIWRMLNAQRTGTRVSKVSLSKWLTELIECGAVQLVEVASDCYRYAVSFNLGATEPISNAITQPAKNGTVSETRGTQSVPSGTENAPSGTQSVPSGTENAPSLSSNRARDLRDIETYRDMRAARASSEVRVSNPSSMPEPIQRSLVRIVGLQQGFSRKELDDWIERDGLERVLEHLFAGASTGASGEFKRTDDD